MKFVGIVASVCLVLCAFAIDASSAVCPAYIPAGVTLRVLPDETLVAGRSTGPTFLTVNSDVRFFPNRPPLLARGSKVLATIVESEQAGRLHGKAHLRLTLSSILTADFCEYPINARIIEAGRGRVEDDVVWGRGHAHRDLIALLFPPTTVYQLVRLPSRGPKLLIDSETPITIKILETVWLGETVPQLSENDLVRTLSARVEQIERDLARIGTAARSVPPAQEPLIKRTPADICWTGATAAGRPLIHDGKIDRPVRNLTPYHVSLRLDNSLVMVFPPCFGPSMITTPTGAFKLEATASLPTVGGQRQLQMKIVPGPEEEGWDIVVDDAAQTTALKRGAESN
jgi:hypothetical protein